MPHPFRKYERKPFDTEGCTKCGLCLSECPVMKLPERKAKAEIASLMQYLANPAYTRPSTERVLKQCTSCFACNLICPIDCRPAHLFLDIWHAKYQREGLPIRARYFLPHSVPNFRTYVLDRLSAKEKAAVESWKSLEPAETIFYPGCNIITTPYLTFSRLFDGLPIRGALEYCCGEMYFRMGLYEQLEQVARKMTGYFKTLGAKKVYMLCTAGLNLFTNILPQFGADFSGVAFIPLLKSLHDRLASGELPIVRRFDGDSISLQDSCHAKVFEEDYCDWPRRIAELIGFTIVEPEQNRQSALCCGIGCGFSHAASYSKADLIRGQRACMKNVQRTTSECVGVYCSGCLEMLSVAKYVTFPAKPVYHILELIQMAIGEEPPRRHRGVAFNFLVGTLLKQAAGKERFFVPPIA